MGKSYAVTNKAKYNQTKPGYQSEMTVSTTLRIAEHQQMTNSL